MEHKASSMASGPQDMDFGVSLGTRRDRSHIIRAEMQKCNRADILPCPRIIPQLQQCGQNVRLYVNMNARGAQLRTGATNFAPLISFCVRNASASSPVELEITRVEITRPLVSTSASTVTRPCLPLSENDGTGVVANA